MCCTGAHRFHFPCNMAEDPAHHTATVSGFNGANRVYIACGYTDLRRGIDGLAALVQQQFQLDPFSNTLFLFCGRRRDRIKALYREGDGFLLLYRRLESGSFLWPRKEREAKAHRPVTGLKIV